MKSLQKFGTFFVLLSIVVSIVWYIGTVYYICYQKRRYVEIPGFETITIWRNHIIFERYTSPFIPQKKYIEIQSTWDNYSVNLTITKDSVLGIWCDNPIKIKELNNYRKVEIFDEEEHESWQKQYDYNTCSETRKDSLRIEISFQMWYPCYPHDGIYIYNHNNELSKGFFGTRSY